MASASSTLALFLAHLCGHSYALRGPWAGMPYDPCFQPPSSVIGYHSDLATFAENLLTAFRHAPLTGLDSLGVLPCVARDSGLWLEFGVYKGGTIRRIANFRNLTRIETRPIVHGFDSFLGLPETWRESQTFRIAGLRRGAFSLGGHPPFAEDAIIKWVPGWFNQSLRPFLRSHRGEHVSLLHVDSDLYSSANTIFSELGPRRLRPGCVIIFDELFNYREYLQHEMKALWEFLASAPHLAVEVLEPLIDGEAAKPPHLSPVGRAGQAALWRADA